MKDHFEVSPLAGCPRHGGSRMEGGMMAAPAGQRVYDEIIRSIGKGIPDGSLEITVAGGRTQTRHVEKGFYARLKFRRPKDHVQLRKRITFVSMREVAGRGGAPKAAEPKPIDRGQPLKVAEPAPKPKPEARPVTVSARFTKDDGELADLVERMRALLCEAGLDALAMRADSDVVQLTATVAEGEA